MSHDKLIAVIGDEDTCVGFLLGGLGQESRDKTPPRNFLVVNQNTLQSDIESTFKAFVQRDDIQIILINENIADMIRHLIQNHVGSKWPAILEIPSKGQHYHPENDYIMRRAKKLSQ